MNYDKMEPVWEHRCDENCQRFCEECNVGICTNDTDDGHVFIAGMCFCITCARGELKNEEDQKA